jgi:hypothetical protein
MKKVISILLAVMMVLAVTAVSASAEITTSGGSDTTRVELTYGTDTDGDDVVDHGANFRVTVPTVIPYTVDSDGNVTTANNLKIQNLCNGQVDVTAVHADTVNGWQLVANGTDFKTVPVDSKQFTMTLNGDNFGAGTSVDLALGSAWTTINGQSELPLTYSGDFAVQSEAITSGHIANVIFTCAWHTA